MTRLRDENKSSSLPVKYTGTHRYRYGVREEEVSVLPNQYPFHYNLV
ncbi:MAG: hypothetical protein ABIA92_05630 [Patescibacteria group bacterium]